MKDKKAREEIKFLKERIDSLGKVIQTELYNNPEGHIIFYANRINMSRRVQMLFDYLGLEIRKEKYVIVKKGKRKPEATPKPD